MNRINRIPIRPLRRLVIRKPNASLLLFFATVIAMLLANSPWASAYHEMLSFPIQFNIGNWEVFSHGGRTMSMLEFVNDALMAVFFFVIGLEIKQEILIGELSSPRKAMLPVIAALGGMVVPVLFYILICPTGLEVRGAAIPMATDIAFALAVLASLGKRVPLSVRIFLTALAVVDDIGGIIVIALFYSGHIAYHSLFVSLGLLAVIYFVGRMRVHYMLFYYVMGFFVWLFFLESGIHPTIAGVLVAFTIPARSTIDLNDFKHDMKAYMNVLDMTEVKHSDRAVVYTPAQIHTLNNMHTLSNKIVSPLQAMVDKLHPWVSYIILPLFAFVNAGVTFGDISLQSLLNVPLAVFLGLFFGKTLGIYLFSYVVLRFRVCGMPNGMTRKVLFGISMLGGIGFTVALFIANLSFDISTVEGADLLNQAKLGVFAGSLLSGVGGYLYLKHVLPKRKFSA
jgi:NhaA family Na+:H+ antiporter